MEQVVGQGGFFFPKVYRSSKSRVVECLKRGMQDLVEISRWTLADEFLAFILKTRFLNFADRTYPNPRSKNEIPVWFVISCQLVMKIHLEKTYRALGTLLKAGPILSRVGFNVNDEIGFNDKNKYKRETPVHPDSVRKFFKDTNPCKMRQWFNVDLQNWFRQMECFDPEGIYILDQTHLVVPRNKNYEDAVLMPVDEHGQRYAGLNEMTDEQKRALKYHPCYTLSTLLHLSYQKQAFHIAGYEFGPGNEDELPQAQRLIQRFSGHSNAQAIKLLIVDRGYISGEFVTELKTTYKIDILIPLRQDMDQHRDAVTLSEQPDANWVTISEEGNSQDFEKVRACTIDDISLWNECKVPLHTTVVEIEQTTSDGGIEIRKFSLCSTRKFSTPHPVFNSYKLRVRVEECFRQLKRSWNISDFPSPDRSLLEAHVGFTLTTYSMLQLYLMRSDLQEKTHQMITSLKREEHHNSKRIIVYVDDHFAAFSFKEYLLFISQLKPHQQEVFAENLENAVNQI